MQNKMPLKQSFIVSAGVIAVVAVVIVALDAVGAAMWMVFLGVTAWSAMGMSFKLRDICSLWLSAAVGLAIAYLMGNAATLGVWALAVGGVGALLMLFGMVSGRMGFIFNSYTAIYVTAGTATGIVIDLKQAIISMVVGFVVFGLIPSIAVNKLSKKKEE